MIDLSFLLLFYWIMIFILFLKIQEDSKFTSLKLNESQKIIFCLGAFGYFYYGATRFKLSRKCLSRYSLSLCLFIKLFLLILFPVIWTNVLIVYKLFKNENKLNNTESNIIKGGVFMSILGFIAVLMYILKMIVNHS